MKPLYVGCRVRILYSVWWPELAGTEGTIIERVVRGQGDWLVSCDLWGSEWCPVPTISPDDGMRGYHCFGPYSDQLESLAPDVEGEIVEEEYELVEVR